LDFLYLPAPDIEAAIRFYRDVLGARLRWKIHAFGAWVACVELGGPPVLLADHKRASRSPQARGSTSPRSARLADPPRGPQLVYRVASFADAERELRQRGLEIEGEPFEIPSGPCMSFRDPAGNQLAIYENRRPRVAASFDGRFD
jgi:catechol 2,3-dioxygenase-like lactoylglutathione lyase family enzyme